MDNDNVFFVVGRTMSAEGADFKGSLKDTAEEVLIIYKESFHEGGGWTTFFMCYYLQLQIYVVMSS